MEANEGPERVELSVCRISDVEIPLLVAALKVVDHLNANLSL